MRPDDPAARAAVSIDEYLAEVLGLVEPLAQTENVPLADLVGRVLARDLQASCDVPAFRNSAMDGYAINSADISGELPQRFRLVGEVAAGSADDPELAGGQAVRILTGAPVPSAADTVIAVEDTTASDGWVSVNRPIQAGRHVRAAASDFAAGQQLFGAGTLVSPEHVGAIAAAGIDSAEVFRRPRVAIISTGDELVEPGGSLGRGQIFQSNAYQLAASARSDGAEVVAQVRSPDEPDAFIQILTDVATSADLVLLSGGISVGDYDVTRIGLERLAAEHGANLQLRSVNLQLRRVKMQPGKPQGWARLTTEDSATAVLAFPGNPLSAGISYLLFGQAAIRRMLHLEPLEWQLARAAASWQPPVGRTQILPVRLEMVEGRLTARPAHQHGSASHMVTALAAADGLAMVDANVEQVNPGDQLKIRRLR